jgi:hypothetical protein
MRTEVMAVLSYISGILGAGSGNVIWLWDRKTFVILRVLALFFTLGGARIVAGAYLRNQHSGEATAVRPFGAVAGSSQALLGWLLIAAGISVALIVYFIA